MTRVLVIAPSFNLGGAEQYLLRVTPRLRELGIAVEICALDPSGPLRPDFESSGIALHGTSFPRWTSKTSSNLLLRAVSEIRQVVKQGRFDVVHTYLYWSDVLGTIGARLAGCRRVIVSRQGMHPFIHGNRLHFHALRETANALASELIANSWTLLRHTISVERLVPRARGVVYAGIDPDRYPRARLARSGLFRLLTVGALDPRKGQEHGLRALRLTLDAGVNCTLTLVGAGPDEEVLRQLARELDLVDHVIFAGQHLDPRPFLQEADLFLLPSRQEGFSSALLEAMACGLPVIATDVGGNAEAIVHDAGGLITAPGDPAAIAAAIGALDGDPKRSEEMGEFNRQRVVDHFTLDSSARRLADWYEHGPIVEPFGPSGRQFGTRDSDTAGRM